MAHGRLLKFLASKWLVLKLCGYIYRDWSLYQSLVITSKFWLEHMAALRCLQYCKSNWQLKKIIRLSKGYSLFSLLNHAIIDLAQGPFNRWAQHDLSIVKRKDGRTQWVITSKIRVVVGMSGGVDSSVTALLFWKSKVTMRLASSWKTGTTQMNLVSARPQKTVKRCSS